MVVVKNLGGTEKIWGPLLAIATSHYQHQFVVLEVSSTCMIPPANVHAWELSNGSILCPVQTHVLHHSGVNFPATGQDDRILMSLDGTVTCPGGVQYEAWHTHPSINGHNLCGVGRL